MGDSWFQPLPLKDKHCGWFSLFISSGVIGSVRKQPPCHVRKTAGTKRGAHYTQWCLRCLQVNTRAVWTLPCLCNKQPGLLWLHTAQRCDNAHTHGKLCLWPRLATNGRHRRHFFCSQAESQAVCSSHTVAVTDVVKTTDLRISKDKAPFVLFPLYFGLVSYRKVGEITRLWTQGKQPRQKTCLFVRGNT